MDLGSYALILLRDPDGSWAHLFHFAEGSWKILDPVLSLCRGILGILDNDVLLLRGIERILDPVLLTLHGVLDLNFCQMSKSILDVIFMHHPFLCGGVVRFARCKRSVRLFVQSFRSVDSSESSRGPFASFLSISGHHLLLLLLWWAVNTAFSSAVQHLVYPGVQTAWTWISYLSSYFGIYWYDCRLLIRDSEFPFCLRSRESGPSLFIWSRILGTGDLVSLAICSAWDPKDLEYQINFAWELGDVHHEMLCCVQSWFFIQSFECLLTPMGSWILKFCFL